MNEQNNYVPSSIGAPPFVLLRQPLFILPPVQTRGNLLPYYGAMVTVSKAVDSNTIATRPINWNSAFRKEPVITNVFVPYRSPTESGRVIPVAQYQDTVQLFLERAKRVRLDFTLTSENLKPVVDICRLLQGLPLRIELAAA